MPSARARILVGFGDPVGPDTKGSAMDRLRIRIRGRSLAALVGLLVAACALVPSPADAQASDTSAPTVTLVDQAKKIVLPGKLPGVVAAPWDLTVTSNAVWVLEPRAGLVFRVAPSTNRVVARVKLPGPGCVPGTCMGVDRIVGDGRDVWVIDNQAKALVHIDACTNKARGSIPMATSTFLPPLVVSGGLWWTPDPASGDISFVDAATGKTTKTVHVGAAPAFPAAMVGETLWASSSVNTGPGTPPADALYRVDPETAEVKETIPGLSGGGAALGADFWLNRYCCPLLTHVDGTTGAHVADVQVEGFSDFFTAGSGSVWARFYSSDMSRHWILRVDPSGASTERFDLPTTEKTGGLGVGFGSLWVTNWNDNAIYRMPAADR